MDTFVLKLPFDIVMSEIRKTIPRRTHYEIQKNYSIIDGGSHDASYGRARLRHRKKKSRRTQKLRGKR